MAKHRNQQMKPGQLNCEEIGCIPKLTQKELEEAEGFWLQYERNSGTKLIRFTIKLANTRIDFAEWADGSKTKWQKQSFSSPKLAREEFTRMIETKKSSGFKFTGSKW